MKQLKNKWRIVNFLKLNVRPSAESGSNYAIECLRCQALKQVSITSAECLPQFFQRYLYSSKTNTCIIYTYKILRCD